MRGCAGVILPRASMAQVASTKCMASAELFVTAYSALRHAARHSNG